MPDLAFEPRAAEFHVPGAEPAFLLLPVVPGTEVPAYLRHEFGRDGRQAQDSLFGQLRAGASRRGAMGPKRFAREGELERAGMVRLKAVEDIQEVAPANRARPPVALLFASVLIIRPSVKDFAVGNLVSD